MFQPFYYKFTPEKQKDTSIQRWILCRYSCYARPGDSTDAESPPHCSKDSSRLRAILGSIKILTPSSCELDGKGKYRLQKQGPKLLLSSPSPMNLWSDRNQICQFATVWYRALIIIDYLSGLCKDWLIKTTTAVLKQGTVSKKRWGLLAAQWLLDLKNKFEFQRLSNSLAEKFKRPTAALRGNYYCVTSHAAHS